MVFEMRKLGIVPLLIAARYFTYTNATPIDIPNPKCASYQYVLKKVLLV